MEIKLDGAIYEIRSIYANRQTTTNETIKTAKLILTNGKFLFEKHRVLGQKTPAKKEPEFNFNKNVIPFLQELLSVNPETCEQKIKIKADNLSKCRLNENNYLHFLFHTFVSVLIANVCQQSDSADLSTVWLQEEFCMIHTFKKYFLRTAIQQTGYAPDFVIFPAFVKTAQNANSFFVVTFVEITTEITDSEHQLKMIKYNRRVLDNQPYRTHVTSLLTDLTYALFFETVRKPNNGDYQNRRSLQYNLHTDQTIKYILNLFEQPDFNGYNQNLPNDLTFVDTDSKQTKFSIERYVGRGRTANVFESDPNDSQVCKVFTDRRLYQQELSQTLLISEELRKLSDPSRAKYFCQQIGRNEKHMAILFSPKCVNLDEQDYTDINMVRQMFACLQTLKDIRVVSREIAPRHLMKAIKTNQLILIDFGFSVYVSSPEFSTTFEGSTRYAANEILSLLSSNMANNYHPQHKHDLESLIKILCIKLFPLNIVDKHNFELSYKSGSCDFLLKFWDDFFDRNTHFCSGILKALANEDSHKCLELFEAQISKSVDFQEILKLT